MDIREFFDKSNLKRKISFSDDDEDEEDAQKLMEKNKKLMFTIVSCIIFSGTHDFPLRDGFIIDLCRLCIESSGDLELKAHFENGPKNELYRSPKTHNEIIDICGGVIREHIVSMVKQSTYYSILGNERAEISEKEQLSVGIRYYDEKVNEIKEEFLGFVELEVATAKAIAEAIDSFITGLGLDPNHCVGLGFDGCDAMSRKEGDVQAILRRKYKNAFYFHCSSHRLNIVVNDLNALPKIGTCIAGVEKIINFFAESALRREYFVKVPKLCEAGWSKDYKSIRDFKDHFVEIFDALETLTTDRNLFTASTAYQLSAVSMEPVFIISVVLIAKYSALLEPVTNSFQSKTLDINQANNHIHIILELFRDHRKNVEKITIDVLKEAGDIAKELEIELSRPSSSRKTTPAESDFEYWKKSVIIPYLDSLISSLEIRFSSDKTPAFSLAYFHPSNMRDLSMEEWFSKISTCETFYDLKGIEGEKELWFRMWRDNKKVQEASEINQVLKETLFFPIIRKALFIMLTLPCTPNERSFSSFRNLNTWLSSTIIENRLDGLAMLSTHHQWVQANEDYLMSEVIKKFACKFRKLLFDS